jgi:hypothetical protein
MKKYAFYILIIIAFVLIVPSSNAIYFEANHEKYPDILPFSGIDNLPLNTYVLDNYNVISYGYPHGNWMPYENGKMTKDNNSTQKGEYQYLGYNYFDEPILNDRYFRKSDLKGNVFDKN